jgi:hypothetical protein
MRRYLSRNPVREEKITVLSLDGVSYFVGSLKEKEGFLTVFLEHFFPFYKAFSSHLLKESTYLFQILSSSVRLSKTIGEKSGHKVDWIAAKTERYRRESAAYRHLLNIHEHDSGEKLICDLSAFLHTTREKLARLRIFPEVCSEELVGAYFSPISLIFIVLSVLQFVRANDEEAKIRLDTVPGKREVTLNISFDDKRGIFRILSALLEDREKPSVFPYAMGYASLFSALFLCRKEKIKVLVTSEGKRAKVSLVLPAVPRLPEAFLGAKDPMLSRIVDRGILQVISGEEKKKRGSFPKGNNRTNKR